MEERKLSLRRGDMWSLGSMMLLTVCGSLWIFIAGTSFAGLGIFWGILLFFVHKAYYRIPADETGITFYTLRAGLKMPAVWLLIFISCLFEFSFVQVSRVLAPGYMEYELSRIQGMVSLSAGFPFVILQLVVLALGEEIAWRGFFQQRLNSYWPLWPSILITTVFFTLGHISCGPIGLVAYGLVEVIVQSIIFGLVFKKTASIYLVACTHFLANLTAFLVYAHMGL